MPLVDVTPNPADTVILRPVNPAVRRRVVQAVTSSAGHTPEVVYLAGPEARRFISTTLRPAQRREVRAGWNVRIRLPERILCELYLRHVSTPARTGADPRFGGGEVMPAV